MSLLSPGAEDEPERFDGLSLLYWTIMGPHGINRAVHRISFSDCQNGLGVKIIGGYRAQTAEDYGIFIKRILPGGVAAVDSRLLTGDLILDVNGENLVGVTNERAVDILRTASASNHMSLLVARDEEANDSAFQIISVCKGTSLGLNIVGGINRNEGPLVYIQEIIPGGDCHKDGRLKPGDQLVSINKESMIGVSYEEAKSIINRTKMRFENFWEIAFIRQKNIPSHAENQQHPFSLFTSSVAHGEQQAAALGPLPSPNGRQVSPFPPNAMETGVKMGEQSPITALDSPADVSATVIVPSQNDDYEPQGKNSSIHLKTEKLERALNYLGIRLTDEQQQALRQQLHKDWKGTVSFGDFVEVSRNLLSVQSNSTHDGHKPASFGVSEFGSLQDSQEELSESVNLKKQLTEQLQVVKQEKGVPGAAGGVLAVLSGGVSSDDPAMLLVLDTHSCDTNEAKAAVEETRALRSRIHLAEAAQRQARGMEMDYEEVIRLLEAEIGELKAQLAEHSGQNKESIQELRKRVTVLDCQLRKSESARKTFEVATEKLLQFVEVVHEILSDNSTSSTVLSDRRSLSTKALVARLGRVGPTVTAALAAEARDLAKSVRAILEIDCLPYGWEEAYTADGIKYFINHVTQTTSWIHPVTSALSLLCCQEEEEDGIRDLPGPKS
ncbi:Syntaxin-binding protein 4 [Turdus rufiventris]|nr:Syntaxin-binding protein 4 [Turdus rufiventris]